MTKLNRLLSVSAITMAALSLACGKQAPAASMTLSRCEQLSKNHAVDESCAIEIAKKAIVTRSDKREYTRFRARFDKHDQVWVVEAICDPGPPGAFVVVAVAKDGKVKGYSPGL
jgi:hypothetical protein